jgi:outer membrane protein TolC
MKQFGSILILFSVLAAVTVRAQFLSPASSASTSSSVTELPASGRATQGAVGVAQQPVAGTTTSVNTLNPTVQISGPFSGSARSKMPFSGKLSLEGALERGLAYNLGGIGLAQNLQEAGAQVKVARSALLPNLTGSASETVEKVDLAAFGLRFSVPGFNIPSVVGPYNYGTVQATVNQTVANLTELNNYRSARAAVRAGQYSLQDARDLVTLAVGGAYLQTLAAQARVDAAQADLDTANAVFHQSTEQHGEGVLGKLNVDQSQVRALTQQQQIITLRNDLAKQKINLARMAGLAPKPNYELTDRFTYSPVPLTNVEEAVARAEQERPDLKAAEEQVKAAEKALAAARAERLPSLGVSVQYEYIGTNPAKFNPAYSAVGTLNIPIWQGGRVGGDIAQAQAVLAQRQAELEDTRGQVEAEVRQVYLDLEAASGQVEVARKNLDVAGETLEMTRARMEAGVINTVEVVQAQQTLSSARLDLVNAIFAHNLAKLNLARALGHASEHLQPLLRVEDHDGPPASGSARP